MLSVFVLIFAALAVLGAFYFNVLIWRFLSLFTEGKPGKGRIFVWVISAVLAVLTLNLFSIFGIYMLHFMIFALIFEVIFKILPIKGAAWIKLYKTALIPAVCAAVVFGYGYANVRNIVKTEYTVLSDKVSEDYKVIFISDAHYGTILKAEPLKELKAQLDRENADIVILGGDIADEDTSRFEMSEVFSVLGRIKSKYGVYYVSGNHDFQKYSKSKAYTKEELEEALLKSGIHYLKDSYVDINNDLLLAGRTDYKTSRRILEEVLEGADKEKYIITADHQPVHYAEAEASGCDLIVSGHTHAGQIFPVGYFIKLFKTADLWYGHEKVRGMDAVVSSGVSGWGYPIRTQKHSEYVVINIKKE